MKEQAKTRLLRMIGRIRELVQRDRDELRDIQRDIERKRQVDGNGKH